MGSVSAATKAVSKIAEDVLLIREARLVFSLNTCRASSLLKEFLWRCGRFERISWLGSGGLTAAAAGVEHPLAAAAVADAPPPPPPPPQSIPLIFSSSSSPVLTYGQVFRAGDGRIEQGGDDE